MVRMRPRLGLELEALLRDINVGSMNDFLAAPALADLQEMFLVQLPEIELPPWPQPICQACGGRLRFHSAGRTPRKGLKRPFRSPQSLLVRHPASWPHRPSMARPPTSPRSSSGKNETRITRRRRTSGRPRKPVAPMTRIVLPATASASSIHASGGKGNTISRPRGQRSTRERVGRHPREPLIISRWGAMAKRWETGAQTAPGSARGETSDGSLFRGIVTVRLEER